MASSEQSEDLLVRYYECLVAVLNLKLRSVTLRKIIDAIRDLQNYRLKIR
jgi:hypothetical protein